MTAGVTATLVRPTGPSPTPAPVSGGRAAGAGRHLADPDPDRLATLGGRLSAAYPGRVEAGTRPRLADADLAVNATPLGLRPGDPPPFAVADLPAHAVVADVIMSRRRPRCCTRRANAASRRTPASPCWPTRSTPTCTSSGSDRRIDPGRGNQAGGADDYLYMACEQWREILSAQLDGEASRSESEAADAHLAGCAGCRAWFEAAAGVTRRARTQLAPQVPDLVDAVLAAAPPPRAGWRERLALGLRGVLGLLGAVQLVLGLAQVGRETVIDHGHATGQHLWHESAAWNVAVGAGFLYVALRRSAPAGLLPMLSAFVATLVLLSVNDLITGQVAVQRLVSHGFLLVGWVVMVLLARPRWRPGGTPPRQGRPAGSRWSLRTEEPPEPAPLRLLPPAPYAAQARHRRAA